MDGPLTEGAVDCLSAYVLPGRTTRPADALVEARDAEAAGFGGVYVSERIDLKEAGAVCGAVVGATTRLRVGTALIHQGTRHPVTIAAMAATLQNLSDGRFVLGLGRGLAALAPSLGLAKPTLESLEHLVRTVRRLWQGERLTEDGPAGSFRGLRFVDLPVHAPPPVYFGGIGPKGLAFAGRTCDGAILHPFLTTQAVADSVALVRRSAEAAGRDPAAVRVVTTLVTGPELSPGREALAVRARAVSYFQVRGLGEQLVGLNGWDPAVLEALRQHPALQGKGIADTAMTRDGLVAAADVLPQAWYDQGAAVGSSVACARRARSYLEAGADEVLVHGASPAEATRMVAAFRALP